MTTDGDFTINGKSNGQYDAKADRIKNEKERYRFDNQATKAFEKASNKVFKNNIDDYTDNDYKFLQELNKMYGMAMSAKGLNVLDPIAANMLHYNKMGMRGNADYPRVNRTYVFFTRPELNFSYENLQAVPFFQWLYSKKIGKLIMASLTDPDYFINAPEALNDRSTKLSNKELQQIMDEFGALIRQMNRDQAKASNDENYQSLWPEDDSNTSDNYDSMGHMYKNETEEEYNARMDYLAAVSGLTRAQVIEQQKGAERKAVEENRWSAQNESQKIREAAYQGTTNVKETSKNYIEDTDAAKELEDMQFASLYDQAKLDNLIQQYTDKQAAEFANIEAKYGIKIDELLAKYYQMTRNTDDPDGVRRNANRNYIYQAKKIFNTSDFSSNYYPGFNFTSPFIPLLGNTCTQCSGAKDFNLESFTSEEDEYGMSQKVATGMDELWGPGSLTTNFEDIAYGPVSLMMMCWVLYIHYVSRGRINTSREHIIERILDYTCSIYVFVVGEDGRRIERWGKYTGCYPTSFPMSSQLEHNASPDQDMLHKISISWQYNRYEPMEPEVLTDFNFLSESEWLVKLTDPLWRDLYVRRDSRKQALWEAFDDPTNDDDYEHQQYWKTLNRNPLLWEPIFSNSAGMSGKIPLTLIHTSEPQSQINALNNYWGGYPYINKGTDLIWVLPQYGSEDGVVKYGKVGAGAYLKSNITNGDPLQNASSRIKRGGNGQFDYMGSDSNSRILNPSIDKSDITGVEDYYLAGSAL